MPNKKKVLVISYAFPPAGGAGVQRPAKFVKYMRNYGYEPLVLTAENPSVPLRDDSLSQDVADTATLLTARTLEPSYRIKTSVRRKGRQGLSFEAAIRSILVPDPQVLWLPGLLKKVLSLRKNAPDLIFVTAPPFSSLVAGVLTKLILKRPLIVDFRDEWVGWLDGSSWSELGTNSRVRAGIDRFLERVVVNFSDAVISASPGYAEAFRKKYPQAPGDKFTVITNGYDPEDFTRDKEEGDCKEVLPAHKLNIVYMGTVFPLTSLKYFLDGLSGTEAKKGIALTVVGRITPEEERLVAAYPDLNIRKIGYLPHASALRLARNADALLLTLSPIKGSERIIPAKIFEYLALQKHILAVLPDGSAADILNGFSGCVTIDPGDTTRVSRACQGLFERWQSHTMEPVVNDVSTHSREKKTGDLCAVFNDVLRRSAEGEPLTVEEAEWA